MGVSIAKFLLQIFELKLISFRNVLQSARIQLQGANDSAVSSHGTNKALSCGTHHPSQIFSQHYHTRNWQFHGDHGRGYFRRRNQSNQLLNYIQSWQLSAELSIMMSREKKKNSRTGARVRCPTNILEPHVFKFQLWWNSSTDTLWKKLSRDRSDSDLPASKVLQYLDRCFDLIHFDVSEDSALHQT